MRPLSLRDDPDFPCIIRGPPCVIPRPAGRSFPSESLALARPLAGSRAPGHWQAPSEPSPSRQAPFPGRLSGGPLQVNLRADSKAAAWQERYVRAVLRRLGLDDSDGLMTRMAGPQPPRRHARPGPPLVHVYLLQAILGQSALLAMPRTQPRPRPALHAESLGSNLGTARADRTRRTLGARQNPPARRVRARPARRSRLQGSLRPVLSRSRPLSLSRSLARSLVLSRSLALALALCLSLALSPPLPLPLILSLPLFLPPSLSRDSGLPGGRPQRPRARLAAVAARGLQSGA